jgi:hypothetical protein
MGPSEGLGARPMNKPWHLELDLEAPLTVNGVPLYPKREWVGLTHDEVNAWELPDSPTVFEFAQFIEAKLKEKNT